MSESSKLLDPYAETRRVIAKAQSPGGLFPEATFADINERQPHLLDLLRTVLAERYPMHVGDTQALKRTVLNEAQRLRGGAFWRIAGVPAQYPTSLEDHQFSNLIERLYLSSQYRGGDTALFGSDMLTAKERSTRITAIAAGASAAALAPAALAWVILRRRRLGNHTGSPGLDAVPAHLAASSRE